MKRVRHVGIVAVSAEGAALCYRTLCSEAGPMLGAHEHPEVTMHTHPLAEYMRCIDRDRWDEVGELLLSSANILARAGAELLICPDNFDELVRGRFEARSRGYFVEVIGALSARGCDAVILGCTEIPLLIAETDSPLPVIDSTRTLARAALREATR